MNLTNVCVLVLALGLLGAASCAGRRDHPQPLDEIAADHDFDLREFQEAQAEFARRNPVPRRIDVPGQGTLLVHESSLEGYPGHVELWLRYSYVNTTGHTIDAANVTITMRDPTTREEWSASEHLALPITFRMTPDSSYTTYAHLPTRGIHLHPGWQWEICAEAIVHGDGK
jgi:hypothetical protein